MKTLDDIKPGQVIGRYEFLVPIAKGGMAAVWAARLKGTRGFAKTVAIKTMLPILSDDPLFEQMFLDEAQIAAQIHHPNVVEIMDLGEQDEILYQVMEYVDGESLATVLRAVSKKKSQLPMEIAVRIVMDACRGLHSAHELKSVDGKLLGLVHRDISPQNIMITYDGVVKLVDFGVAKAAGRTASETTAGQIKGKAPYMAPEQALGQKVDRRTDLFAMGIVLYQVTTGKHPFRGENDIATLHNILHNELPSPRFVDPQYPRPLEAVLNRALSRQVGKRFTSAKDMADALSKVFPPTRRRVDVSDVGAFIQELLGESGNKRRAALADAIKRADTRTGSPTGNDSSGAILLPLAEIGTESTVDGPRVVAAPTERINVEEFVNSGRISHPGLPSIPNLADRLSAPPTVDLDLDNTKRKTETVRPGAKDNAPAPEPPLFDPARQSLPSFENLPDQNLSISGTAPAAMLSSPDLEQPKARRPITTVAAFIGAAIVIGTGVGLTAWALLRSPTSDVPSAPVVSTAESVVQPAAPDVTDAAPVYDLESISDPITEQEDAAVSVPAVKGKATAVVPPPPKTAKPKETTAPPATTKAPPTAKPESTWKPPPVSDPGF